MNSQWVATVFIIFMQTQFRLNPSRERSQAGSPTPAEGLLETAIPGRRELVLPKSVLAPPVCRLNFSEKLHMHEYWAA